MRVGNKLANIPCKPLQTRLSPDQKKNRLSPVLAPWRNRPWYVSESPVAEPLASHMDLLASFPIYQNPQNSAKKTFLLKKKPCFKSVLVNNAFARFTSWSCRASKQQDDVLRLRRLQIWGSAPPWNLQSERAIMVHATKLPLQSLQLGGVEFQESGRPYQ